MKTFKDLNIVALVVFVLIFAIGATESGYASMYLNIIPIILMTFSALGILIQFAFLNIYILNKTEKKSTL